MCACAWVEYQLTAAKLPGKQVMDPLKVKDRILENISLSVKKVSGHLVLGRTRVPHGDEWEQTAKSYEWRRNGEGRKGGRRVPVQVPVVKARGLAPITTTLANCACLLFI